MEALKYKIIKTKEQYFDYCNELEQLLASEVRDERSVELTELLTCLIEKWDEEHNSFSDTDPVLLLKHLMEENGLKAKDLVQILGVSKSLVSDILHYKKGFSKEIIRALSGHFKVSQEAFNRPYKLIVPANAHLRNASVMNTQKQLAADARGL